MVISWKVILADLDWGARKLKRGVRNDSGLSLSVRHGAVESHRSAESTFAAGGL
jgi:hypothetical protein